MSQENNFNFQIFYPYELNEVLNPKFSNQEHISNYTSLLSDKDRFQNLITIFSKYKTVIEEIIGIEFEESQQLFIIRAELFESVSEPLIIEYQIEPEKMILNILKEMIKNNLGKNQIRFIDEIQQEELLISGLKHITEYIDSNEGTKISQHINYSIQISLTKLTKKGFKTKQEDFKEYSLTKESSLLSIIEKSYEQLY